MKLSEMRKFSSQLLLLTSNAGFMLTSAFDVINSLPFFLRRYQRIVSLNCAWRNDTWRSCSLGVNKHSRKCQAATPSFCYASRAEKGNYDSRLRLCAKSYFDWHKWWCRRWCPSASTFHFFFAAEKFYFLKQIKNVFVRENKIKMWESLIAKKTKQFA